MLIGQLKGRTRILSFSSNSSNKSNGSFPSRSILLMNMITGVLRMRQTSINRMVCSSTPFTQSITRITLSTAVKVR